MDDLKTILFILFIVAFPLADWIFKKIAESRAAGQARRVPGAAGTARERAPAARDEEDDLEGWLDPDEWRTVEEVEADRAPPPRRHPVLEEEGPTIAGIPTVRERPLPRPPARRGPPVSRVPRTTSAPIAPAPRTAPEPPVVAPRAEPPPPPRAPVVFVAAESEAPRGTRPEVATPIRSIGSIESIVSHGAPGRRGSGGTRRLALPSGNADLRRAVVWSEILGRPRALRPPQDEPYSPPM